MPRILGPNTLGTLVILTAAIFLIIVSLSAPIRPSINFLQAVVPSSVSTTAPTSGGTGIIKMGVFGYCISTPGQEDFCSPISIGYPLDPNVLLNIPTVGGYKLSNTVIEVLTKALVLHAIAAGLAVLAVISGIVSHIEEFSRTCWTSCLTSLASTIALLAFIFDLIVFSGARARINSVNNSSGSNIPTATLGSAIWLTLIAWVCLAFSGCFFCAGRCICSFRGPPKKNNRGVRGSEK